MMGNTSGGSRATLTLAKLAHGAAFPVLRRQDGNTGANAASPGRQFGTPHKEKAAPTDQDVTRQFLRDGDHECS